MPEIGLAVITIAGFMLPGVYIGLQMAVAWTVFKALTKKR